MGGELKSTFCLVKDGQAILSQHQGDLQNAETFDDYCKNLRPLRETFQHRPAFVGRPPPRLSVAKTWRGTRAGEMTRR